MITVQQMKFLLGAFISSILAGVYVGIASQGSTMAAYNLLADPNTYGLGKLVIGIVFPTGLMLIIIGGGDLFTGKMLLGELLFSREVRFIDMIKNWTYTYLGNFIGALLVVYLIHYSNLLGASNGLLKEVSIKIASYKVQLPFLSAFFLGVLCNWVVCVAIRMTRKANDITGKILCCFFPIFLFATSGFEHSIANMYYIPIGIVASNGSIPGLSWSTFFINNLLPVTLGNIVGGFVFVSMAYYYSEKWCNKN